MTEIDIIDSRNEPKVIPIDDDDIVKVRTTATKPNYIRIHVYLGTLCRSEIFDKSKEFDDNKDALLEKFGIGSKLPPDEQRQERSKYILKLVNGGHVDANNLVFHDDRVIILPKEEYLKQ